MSRKLRYLFRLIFNFFRIPLLKVLTVGKFESPTYMLASPRSEFRIEEKGSIFIKKLIIKVMGMNILLSYLKKM